MLRVNIRLVGVVIHQGRVDKFPSSLPYTYSLQLVQPNFCHLVAVLYTVFLSRSRYSSTLKANPVVNRVIDTDSTHEGPQRNALFHSRIDPIPAQTIQTECHLVSTYPLHFYGGSSTGSYTSLCED